MNALAGNPLRSDGAALNAILAVNSDLNEKLKAAVNRSSTAGADMFSVDTILCPNGQCMYELDGKPLYMDNNHLTLTGASVLKPFFIEIFNTNN